MRLLKLSGLVATILLSAILTVGLVSLRAALRSSGQAAFRNGDVNCDGKLDITDPINLLQWLSHLKGAEE